MAKRKGLWASLIAALIAGGAAAVYAFMPVPPTTSTTPPTSTTDTPSAVPPGGLIDQEVRADLDDFVYGGAPKTSRPLTSLINKAYVVGYDEARKAPAWVAYELAGETAFKGHKRVSRFSVDERTTARVKHDDYTKSGFSRGRRLPGRERCRRSGGQRRFP